MAVDDLETRALRKRITLPGQFTYPVLIEQVTVVEDAVLARVRRPDGGLEDVTLEVAELEAALSRAETATTELVSGKDVSSALEAVRIRLAYRYDPYFAVAVSGARAPETAPALCPLAPRARLRVAATSRRDRS